MRESSTSSLELYLLIWKMGTKYCLPQGLGLKINRDDVFEVEYYN